jgi:signal transduction histidine kinase
MRIMRGTLFANRAARQSFVFLLIGLILLISAALSVFGMYLLYGRHPVSRARLADEAIRSVIIARSIPIAELPKAVRVLSQHGVHVKMASQPDPKAQIMELADPKNIRHYIYDNSYDYRMSIQLANGQWLNVSGGRPRSFWISLGALISGFALLFALIIVCIWPLKRLAWPWDAFTKAARRFGIDLEAPPLALTGPREMQVVIRAFNEMQSRIRRLLNDRTQMLAAISHDLRTPITRLQLRAEYLEGSEQYEKTVSDLNEMEGMISSILSFARDSASKEPMERFDLNALLESLCGEMQDVGHPVIFENDDTRRIPYFGRISAIKRALSNLIENAIKYGYRATVTMKKDVYNGIQITIEDEGPGISDDQMEKVFSPFYRVDTSRSLKTSGTGLGMATARDIIRAHGGEIKLYNLCSKGLRVLVTLPERFEN